MRLLLTLLFALATVSTALGQSITEDQADLVRLAAPDLVAEGQGFRGTLTLPLRNLAYPEDAPIDAASIAFSSIEERQFTSGNRDHVALLLPNMANDGFSALLLVFDVADTPRLVDLADVASDQFTSLRDSSLLPIAAGDEALLVDSGHGNSSQGYLATSVIGLIDGRLETLASAFALRENSCGLDRQQVVTIAPLIGTSGHWQPFAVTVTEATLPAADDCGNEPVPPGTRSVATTFSWDADAHAYRHDSDALDVLLTETQARF